MFPSPAPATTAFFTLQFNVLQLNADSCAGHTFFVHDDHSPPTQHLSFPFLPDSEIHLITQEFLRMCPGRFFFPSVFDTASDPLPLRNTFSLHDRSVPWVFRFFRDYTLAPLVSKCAVSQVFFGVELPFFNSGKFFSFLTRVIMLFCPIPPSRLFLGPRF